jgi:hypothetical protein
VNIPDEGEMNASELIDDYIAGLTDWRGVTLSSIRKIIHDADPEIVEEWKWRGTPIWSHDGIICLAKAFKNKVKLTFFEGASLPDPDKFFNAELEGKQWRALDLYKGDQIDEKSLRILVHAAVAHRHTGAETAVKTRTVRGSVEKKPAE